MDLEGIMLSDINQTKKGKYCMMSLICGIKKHKNSQVWKTDWWLPQVGGCGVGELEEGGQKVQTSSYKVNKL